MLEENGCAVLVGPPGTGKSHTIANVICHYLAKGRRVLVTSKGEPATEVLRNKLPPGIRDLCVSLGCGDTASFRRLEGAVESLANHVAATPQAELTAVADRLRRRFEAICSELEALKREEADWASIYFPPTDTVSHPLKQLTDKVHKEHLEVLGVPMTGTMQQLADAVCAALPPSPSPSPSMTATATATASSLPTCAFFLEDDEPDIDPSTAPPSQELVARLRKLRRLSGDALSWEDELESRSAQAKRAEECDVQAYRELATKLRHQRDLTESVKHGALPRIADRGKAEQLEKKLGDIVGHLGPLHDALQKAKAGPSTAASTSAAPGSASPGASNGPGWIFELFRHAGSSRCQRYVKNVNLLLDRLDSVYARVAEDEERDVSIPRVILNGVINLPLSSELILAPDGSDIDNKVIGSSDFVTEIGWRAHPNKGMWASLKKNYLTRSTPSQTLLAELDEVKFDGRPPSSPHEWQLVERHLVLVSCMARLREEWAKLGTLANNVPVIPPYSSGGGGGGGGGGAAAGGHGADSAFVTFVQAQKQVIDLGATVMGWADGLGDMAAAAHGKALSVLNALSRGPAACDTELTKLRSALEIEGSILKEAQAGKADLLKDFGACEAGSPVDKLRQATEYLGTLELPPMR